jgi:hypothetical protein
MHEQSNVGAVTWTARFRLEIRFQLRETTSVTQHENGHALFPLVRLFDTAGRVGGAVNQLWLHCLFSRMSLVVWVVCSLLTAKDVRHNFLPPQSRTLFKCIGAMHESAGPPKTGLFQMIE